MPGVIAGHHFEMVFQIKLHRFAHPQSQHTSGFDAVVQFEGFSLVGIERMVRLQPDLHDRFPFIVLGQIGTLYYFIHFLILLPLLGKIERTRPLPTSIAEAVLLGNLAYRAGGFDWNAQTLETGGNTSAQGLIRESYRKGWEI